MWGDEEDVDSEEGNIMILKVFTMFMMFNKRGNPIMVNIFIIVYLWHSSSYNPTDDPNADSIDVADDNDDQPCDCKVSHRDGKGSYK